MFALQMLKGEMIGATPRRKTSNPPQGGPPERRIYTHVLHHLPYRGWFAASPVVFLFFGRLSSLFSARWACGFLALHAMLRCRSAAPAAPATPFRAKEGEGAFRVARAREPSTNMTTGDAANPGFANPAGRTQVRRGRRGERAEAGVQKTFTIHLRMNWSRLRN